MTYPDGTPYTETDTRTKLINPALYDAGWTEDHIQRERSPGAVLVDAGGRGKRDTERVDDLLCLPIRDAELPLPIGVIEAKAADKSHKLGLQQAKDYANRLKAPFVFSSNGYKCSFYNDFTGITLDIDLINFPFETGDARHDGKFFLEHYAENEFDLVIIDECHRSAWGQWSIVLTRNSAAIQIGLTATPRILVGGNAAERHEDEVITANNLAYFGEPVDEYTIAQAQADGYLAAAEIIKRVSSLDQLGGLTREELAAKRPTDPITGALLTADDLEELYTNHDYNRILILPDLVQAMCTDLFMRLCEHGDPYQKTIVFCARDVHADDVATALGNLYAQWCVDNGFARRDSYVFKLTSAAQRPEDLLRELKGASRSHYIATTVDLLSTGIDVPWLENIVFFNYIGSPIRFYQMLGRGTRIAEGKLTFRIYDYTDASRLLGEDFITQARRVPAQRETRTPPVQRAGGVSALQGPGIVPAALLREVFGGFAG